MPIWEVIINSYEIFDERFQMKYEEQLLILAREGSKYGILFIITASSASGIRYRLGQNFSKKVVLQLNNDDEYYSIYGKVRKKETSKIIWKRIN